MNRRVGYVSLLAAALCAVGARAVAEFDVGMISGEIATSPSRYPSGLHAAPAISVGKE